MRITTHFTSLVAAVALAPFAIAQDSVSKLQALPGDAVDAHDVVEQVNDFVVDLAARKSSWNNTFGIAPLLKGSLPSTVPASTFFTSLISAHAMSRTLRSDVPFLRSSYSRWTTAGQGVNNNPARNDPGTAVDTSTSSGYQFAAALSEFSTGGTDPAGNAAAINGVVGGIVNFESSRPSRLYVSRIVAAINGSTDNCNVAQVGMGVVDSHGNVHFRAEGFGATDCGGDAALTGNNLFRAKMQNRNGGLVNVISNAGGVDAGATDWLLVNSTITHNTPNAIPEQLAGRPILFGSNFNKDYVFEQVAGAVVAQNQAHFAPGVTDHRGAMGYTPANFPSLFAGSTNGTGTVIAVAGATTSIALFGLGANGSAASPIARTLPAIPTLSDPVQAWNNGAVAGSQQFGHYFDQTAFRGGSGQIALGQDQAGRLLAAGVVYYGIPVATPNTNPNNYIAVARIDPLGGTTTWSVAAWTVGSTGGKTIFQNGTTPIGRLKGWFGPAMSAPMIDSVGNVWFLGAIEVGGVDTVGLLRAVLNSTTTPFSYTLELVFKQGDVIAGRNSGKNYSINRLEITDGNSVSSGTAYSSNMSSVAHLGQSTTGLSTSDSRTLGGLVINARIVYDVNGDDVYDPASSVPGSPDEDYQVLLYIASTVDADNNGIPDDQQYDRSVFCFGDGSGTSCPCGNNSLPTAQSGCLNSLGLAGKLVSSGVPSLSADTIVLSGTNMPNASALYFQGTSQLAGGAGTVFGDGLRCAGGTIIRLGTKTNTSNSSQYPTGADLSVSVRGLVGAPGIRTYQVWYRNAAGFCTSSTFNLTNGVEILWGP